MFAKAYVQSSSATNAIHCTQPPWLGLHLVEARQGIISKLCLQICYPGMPPAHSHGAILLCHELCSIIAQLHEGKLPCGWPLCHKLTPTPGGGHGREDWPAVFAHSGLDLKTNVQLLNMPAWSPKDCLLSPADSLMGICVACIASI